MQACPGNIVCKFGDDGAICAREQAIFVTGQKCLYYVTVDLDRDLEDTLGAGPSVDLCVNVWWRLSHLPVRSSSFCDKTKVPVSRDL